MASNTYRGLTIELNAKTTALSSALRQVESEAKSIQRELKQVEKSASLDGAGTATAQRQMELYRQAIESAQSKLTTLKEAESQIGEADMSTDQWTKLQSEIEQTEGKIDDYKAKLEELEKEQETQKSSLYSLGTALEDNADKFEAAGEKMQTAGTALTKTLTAATVAVGAASVSAAVDIDTSLTNVRKTVDGTEEDYQALKEAAIEFSKTNAVSASDILDIEALGAQLGYTLEVMENGKTQIEEFGEVVSGLDIATNMDAETAGTNLAQFANITQMAKEETSNYASAIVELGNNLATTESAISDMSQRVAAAGTQVGMSEAEILGLSGAMSSLGIEAEAGGTAISNFLSSIDAAVATGGDELQAYADIAGMSAEQFASSWKESAADTLQAILEGIAGADNMTLALESMGVTGVRQSDVLKRLAGNTELVANAIDLASTGWEENTALSDEVANRNSSLASQFEILKNRVTAVAEEIGEPLCNALLDALDAAEPLFEAIENGAQAFTEMDEGQQRAIITAAGLAAALGPTLTITGKLVASLGSLGTSLKSAAGIVTEMKTAISGLTLSSTALKAGLAGIAAVAAVAVVSFAVSKWQEWREEQEKTASAARSVSESIDLARDSIGDTAPTVGTAAEYYTKLKDSIKETSEAATDLRDSLAEASENLTEGMTDYYTQGTELEYYTQKIDELRDTEGLTAAQQYELESAVESYNRITGDSLEVIDAQNGRLSENAEQVRDVIRAWEEEAELSLYKDDLTAQIQTRAEAEQQLQTALENQAAAQEKVNYYREKLNENPSSLAYQSLWSSAQKELDAANESVDEIQGTIDTTTRNIEDLEGAINSTTTEFEAQESAIESLQTVIEAFGTNTQAALDAAGLSTAQLSEALYNAGISSESLAGITDETFAAMLESVNGDVDALAQRFQQLDDLGIDPKTVTITDGGTWMTTMGELDSLQAYTIGDKTFYVADNGTIYDENMQLVELDDKQIGDKTYYVNDAGTIYDENMQLVELDDKQIGTKNFTINSNVDEQSSKIDTLATKFKNLTNFLSVSISTVTGNASGGISRVGIHAVPHADGGISGIVTSPTLTNVGLVGEDGAEAVLGNAIIPLTNTRYVTPFAHAVASEMADMVGGITKAEMAEVMDAAMRGSDAPIEIRIGAEKVASAVAPYMNRTLGTMSRRGRI